MERALALRKPRLDWIDNLRWLLIVMVVLVHVCVTYSGLGGWYYKEGQKLDLAATIVFFAYELLSQAIFMGLLFLLAGYFAPAAYDRKGAGRFALDRLVRLGVPTVVFMFVLHPLTELIKELFLRPSLRAADVAAFFRGYLGRLEFFRETGPLWFALALLVLCLVYAAVRRLAEALSRPGAGVGRQLQRVTHGLVAALAPGHGRRLVPGAPGAAPGHELVQPAAVLLPPVHPAFPGRAVDGTLSGNERAFAGGLHWQAAAFALWEAFFCVGICLGLIVLYRERARPAPAVLLKWRGV